MAIAIQCDKCEKFSSMEKDNFTYFGVLPRHSTYVESLKEGQVVHLCFDCSVELLSSIPRLAKKIKEGF